jgi:hypothetical protein
MNKQLQNKLKTYSSLTAVAAFTSSTVDAQIVHTTVNYTGGYETYDIDIDNNGDADFRLTAFATQFTYGGAYRITIGAANVEGLYGNRAVGIYGSYFNSLYALNAGNIVNSTNASFVSSGALAGTFEVEVDFYGFWIPAFGSSFGQFGDGSSKFVGVEFENQSSGDTHYGWLRFTNVAQNGSSWTLVDMAYNTVAGEQIVTGQTLSVKENKRNMNVFADANNISIMTDGSLMNAKVDVVNMLGQTVANTVITSNTTSIANTFGSGIYIVRISDEKGKAITRKIKL